jgi:hypothetical protein
VFVNLAAREPFTRSVSRCFAPACVFNDCSPAIMFLPVSPRTARSMRSGTLEATSWECLYEGTRLLTVRAVEPPAANRLREGVEDIPCGTETETTRYVPIRATTEIGNGCRSFLTYGASSKVWPAKLGLYGLPMNRLRRRLPAAGNESLSPWLVQRCLSLRLACWFAGFRYYLA